MNKDINKLNEVEMTQEEIADFKQRLYRGEVHFQFIKKDGTLREARGTMNPEVLPPPPPERQYDQNRLRRANRPANIICFYDLDAQGFRSFDANRFEGIID